MVSLGLADSIWEDKSVNVPSASNDISSFGLVSIGSELEISETSISLSIAASISAAETAERDNNTTKINKIMDLEYLIK